MRRIVCIGNRWVPSDGAGPAVHDLLSHRPLPDGVELVDGGVGGLALLPLLDGADRVVFVDAVSGFAPPGEALLLPAGEVAAAAVPDDHGGGLPYLLRVLPEVSEGPVPAIAVVGVEAGWSADTLDRAASLALWAALDATPGSGGPA